MLGELWADVVDTSQPFQQTVDDENIWQVPNNGCLADYTTAEDNLEVFMENAAAAGSENTTQFVSLGFHQETALLYLDELERGLRLIEEAAISSEITLEYIASPYVELISSASR